MQTDAAMIAILRLEGLALGIVCVSLYYAFHQSWWLFAILFLTPDLAMLGYLAGPRIGAVAYNLVHSWVTVAVAAFLAWQFSESSSLVFSLPFILGAHIGVDRALGYGLKLPTGFKDTHLGRIGKTA